MIEKEKEFGQWKKIFPHWGYNMDMKRIFLLGLIRKVNNFYFPLIDFYFSGIIKKNYYIKMINGLIIKIRPKTKGKVSDIDIFKEVIIDDEYMINKIIKDGDIILDVGACSGMFSLFASKLKKSIRIFWI